LVCFSTVHIPPSSYSVSLLSFCLYFDNLSLCLHVPHLFPSASLSLSLSLSYTQPHTHSLSLSLHTYTHTYTNTPAIATEKDRHRQVHAHTLTCRELRITKMYAMTMEKGTSTPHSQVRPRIGRSTSTAFTAALHTHTHIHRTVRPIWE